jgi:site-specific recombinase XerD
MEHTPTTVISPPAARLNALERIAAEVEMDAVYRNAIEQDAHTSRGTLARASENALRDDVLKFSGWCADAGLAHMPATAETLAAFIDFQSEAGKAVASIRRYCASIAAYHRAARAPNPMELKTARDALKRVARARRDEKQAQARGITDDDVVRMLEASPRHLVGLRNKALLVTAYSTLARRGELVSLLAEDLQVDSDQFGRIRVRRSKTDQTAQGAYVAITADAMHHLRAWMSAAGIEQGPLFRSVDRHRRVGGHLPAAAVSMIFKGMAKAARLSTDTVARISGHSSRVGAASDMVRYGADIAGAMQAGRWKTPAMVSRYCEGLELKRGAVAQVSTRRKQFV